MPTSITNTGITFPDGTTQTTAATSSGGTVTSVATGNGLQGGAITTSGTLSVACPGANTVGSYAQVAINGAGGNVTTVNFGSNYAAGGGTGQIRLSLGVELIDSTTAWGVNTAPLSGTWKWLGDSRSENGIRYYFAIACRVS